MDSSTTLCVDWAVLLNFFIGVIRQLLCRHILKNYLDASLVCVR